MRLSDPFRIGHAMLTSVFVLAALLTVAYGEQRDWKTWKLNALLTSVALVLLMVWLLFWWFRSVAADEKAKREAEKKKESKKEK